MRSNIFLLITLLTAMALMAIAGCETVGEPDEEETAKEGRLPEWLQLAYRQTEGYRFDYDENEIEDDPITEEDLIDPEPIDDTADPDEEPVEETEEKLEEPKDEEDAAPATAEATEPADDAADDDTVGSDKPKPGTMDYVIWKQEQEKGKEEEKSVFDKDDRWWEVEADPAGFSHDVIKHGDE